jgi:hypothetical protein
MWIRFCVGLVALLLALTAAQAADDAWVEPQDPAQAINDPDRYAWRLFIALNWPADVPNKKPDSKKKFGDAGPGPVTWETWRNARNEAVDTAFPLDGSDPGDWLSKDTPPSKPASAFDSAPLQELLINPNSLKPKFDEAIQDQGNETRLNEAAYNFVRENKLYNLDDQVKLFSGGKTTIVFPLPAKEIKAQWRKIEAKDKERYHWVEFIGEEGETALFGLTALHITTKDVPNWFWGTFEHIDNKLSEKNGGKKDAVGWLTRSRDTFACPTPPHDCELAPTGIGLQGTKWQNYRLRGTQLDFTTSLGKPTILANSQPEARFQDSSSCITCHARSTIGSKSRLAIFKCRIDDGTPRGTPVGDIGTPNPSWFEDPKKVPKFTQLDFVWSLMRAHNSKGQNMFPPQAPLCTKDQHP